MEASLKEMQVEEGRESLSGRAAGGQGTLALWEIASVVSSFLIAGPFPSGLPSR
jgi:hypothetical protein